jgi:enoyl-CoA hydratase/carnithine racemase
MSHNSLLFERLGHVARITLNRPQRANALNAAMLDEINQALDEI